MSAEQRAEEVSSGTALERALLARTKAVALQTIRLVDSLPRSTVATVIGRQLLRSATSVGANYRAACRARSIADMVAKLSLVEEEGDESMYWLELLQESGLLEANDVDWLYGELNQIVALTVSSRKRLKASL